MLICNTTTLWRVFELISITCSTGLFWNLLFKFLDNGDTVVLNLRNTALFYWFNESILHKLTQLLSLILHVLSNAAVVCILNLDSIWGKYHITSMCTVCSLYEYRKMDDMDYIIEFEKNLSKTYYNKSESYIQVWVSTCRILLLCMCMCCQREGTHFENWPKLGAGDENVTLIYVETIDAVYNFDFDIIYTK